MVELRFEDKKYKLKPGDVISVWHESGLWLFGFLTNNRQPITFWPDGDRKHIIKTKKDLDPQMIADFASYLFGFDTIAKCFGDSKNKERFNFELSRKTR